MPLQLKYFASIREALGSGETFEFADGASLGELRDVLIARGGPHAEALARSRNLRCAVNQVMADEGQPVHADDEVAFFPPVTGG